ncbi:MULTISPECIES: LysR family transcriptional regulator [Staphylococcus]|uniref:Pca operon transcriptional activator PcaQ n=1 Tax=Staphylococcus cohnii subsp. cohnii TaxID=74704 RepID=A0A0M2NUI5_STACC|nr:LysR family transcriptional regulator [Staphylococcus cohnii]KKI63396.1 Pca operon transcriptional activator PcaQ [Staphylococcus cohnii subsp. cohnii]
MNIDYIEDFIKVAECQSLNQASDLLNISTPALSKRIKHIENYFECDLFYRTSRGIFLTKNGEIVLENLLIVRQNFKNLKLQIFESINSNIRLGLLPSFSLYKLENSKKKMLDNNIEIKIENNTQILLEHLYNGDIDVIIGDITSNESQKLFYKYVYSEDYMIVYSRNSGLINNDSIAVDTLKNYKIFVLTPPCDTLAFIRKNFSEMKLEIEYKDNLESIFASVKTGQGITIIPKSLTTRVESMNLQISKLGNYSRDVGLIGYNKKTLDNVFEMLPEV